MQTEQPFEVTETKLARTNNEVPIPAIRLEGLAEIAHDACNMIAALNLYCDLLEEPGVLAAPFRHYGSELRLVAAASRRLVDKLVSPGSAQERLGQTLCDCRSVPAKPITNLAEELLANRNLLAALSGPAIAVTVDVQGGALPVLMTGEDLTRILVNLVKNASEAMLSAGRIHIMLWESSMDSEDGRWLTLNVEDNGPGLTQNLLDHIFDPRQPEIPPTPAAAEWQVRRRRGLGLWITRSIVEAAGGVIHAANRDPAGACFQIQLPVDAATPSPKEHHA